MSNLLFLKSIRGKIAALFFVIFGAVLVLFSVVLYHLYARQQRIEFDNSITTLALSIEESIKENGVDEQEILKEVSENPLPVNFGNRQYAEIINQRRSVIVKSTRLGNASLPISRDAIEKVLNGEKVWETSDVAVIDSLWNEWGIRLLAYPAAEPEGQRFAVVIGVPLATLEESLLGLRLIFYTVIPLTLLLAAAAGWFLAKRAFDPIDRIVSVARNFTAEQLHQRLPVSPVDDELSRLSKTLNEMIERLEKSFEQQKQFTADASHELRTPLTILKGEMEVTLQSQRAPDEYEQVLHSSVEEIQRLQKIVDGLLLISQVESVPMNDDAECFRIDELLTVVVQKVSRFAKSKNVSLILNLYDYGDEAEHDIGGIGVRGDAAKLTNVFMNLLDNAIKFSPDGGRVECRLDATTENATIAVSDNGPGIPANHLSNVFNRFYRASESRTQTEISGTGLGLSIAQSVVKWHHGTIDIQSAEGRGTIVNVHLPRAKST